MDTDIEQALIRKGVRPTANRILVMRELMNTPGPASLADLDKALDTVDTASIFRVLDLFSKKNLVHVIEDGSRSVKYELCPGHTGHSIGDQHVHFFCERCRKTYCLESVSVPAVDIPDGFRPSSANYLLKGLCPTCVARGQQASDQ